MVSVNIASGDDFVPIQVGQIVAGDDNTSGQDDRESGGGNHARDNAQVGLQAHIVHGPVGIWAGPR